MAGRPVDRDDERWAEFVELVERLREDSASPETVVLVEGEHDVRSLRRLGLTGRIHLLHHGNTLSEVAEEVARRGRKVIVLTDWDTAGGQLAQRLKEFLSGSHLEVDLETRRKLARALRGEVVHVEGLAGWARRNADVYGGTLDELLPGRPPLDDV